ncbi:MAG: hypothetical protein IT436_02555 [Phycisphaerales bacterium]|nr:hypothetical protein [Phycisphaerales bacterium]
MYETRRVLVGAAMVLGFAGSAAAGILGQHHFTWWDDGVVASVTARGAPPPTPGSIPLFDIDEWHLDQAQTTQWYAGMAIAGLPNNPFNPMFRNGLTPGSVIPAMAGAEAFIYQATNINYGSGAGFPPFGLPPYSFTGPPGLVGMNDLSGFNIRDTGGALQVAMPAAGSQFMSSFSIPTGTVLDMTPAFVAGVLQDWDFNAHSGPGNFEWDLPGVGVGAFIGGPGVVFGYAMPGNWLDQVNDGWAHSWNNPAGAVPVQVNQTPTLFGWSGPAVPGPGGLVLMAGLMVLRRRR